MRLGDARAWDDDDAASVGDYEVARRDDDPATLDDLTDQPRPTLMRPRTCGTACKQWERPAVDRGEVAYGAVDDGTTQATTM